MYLPNLYITIHSQVIFCTVKISPICDSVHVNYNEQHVLACVSIDVLKILYSVIV